MLKIILKNKVLGLLIMAKKRHIHFADNYKKYNHKNKDIYHKYG